MSRGRRRKPRYQKEIARERIEILFDMAARVFDKEPELSKRYVKLARRIGMKYNLPLPGHLKRRFCKKCGAFLAFGKNSVYRIDSERKRVVIVCKECGHRTELPYKGTGKQPKKKDENKDNKE